MYSKIINIILVLVIFIVFYFGLVVLFNIGMIEKNEINVSLTNKNIIHLSVETRINEITTVRTLIKMSFILGIIVIIKLLAELFARKR